MKTKLTLYVTVLAAGLFVGGCASPLEKGLVAYYPFNGNAQDESGNENHGEIHGAKLAQDRHGRVDAAFEFGGSKDYIEVQNASNLSNFDSVAISCWIKMNVEEAKGTEGVVTKWWQGPRGDLYAIFVSGHRIETGSYHYTQNDGIFSNPITSNDWQFAVFVHDGKIGGSLYLNGQLVGHRAVAGAIPSYDNVLRIGAGNDEGRVWRFFKGSIDDVRIYNRALSTEEVKALYNLEQPTEGN